MMIEVKDLKKGDEIIISSYSELRYLRVLRDPQPRNDGVKHPNGTPYYRAIRCSLYRERLNSVSGWSYYSYKHNPENHNYERYFDLNKYKVCVCFIVVPFF